MADFYVKNGLFDRKRLLRLQPETIEFEVNDTKDNLFIKCRKEEVKAFKYYDERLQFDMFRVGLSLKKYYTYFAVYSKINADKRLLIDFKNNWNSTINYEILKTITNHINPQQ